MSSLMSAIQKRDALHARGQKTGAPSTKQKLGELLETENWLSDALDFYSKAGATDKILSVQKKAVSEGNVFLFLKAQKMVSEQIPKELLEECTKTAESNGMTRYAILGFEKLGDEENALRLRETVINDGDIVLEDSTDVFIPDSTEE